ncbi:MAG: pyrroline-5-carboxylate reductase [Oceanicoccus sp.]
MSYPSITFIGAGNMAASIIGGLVAKGFPAANITASAPRPHSLIELEKIAAVNTCNDNMEAIAGADVIIMAVKPQMMKSVLENMAIDDESPKPLIISIAAGIETSSLEKWLGGGFPIVRCMPNTPALVQTGATALYANAIVNSAQRKYADDILSAVGIVLWVDAEENLDAVTAVSGSGPAYFFMMIEAMQAAGEQLGLSADAAKQLTIQTALGAAQMAKESDVSAAELRRRVSSPGGTTVEAIRVFEEAGLADIVTKAMTACRDRSAELAKILDAD